MNKEPDAIGRPSRWQSHEVAVKSMSRDVTDEDVQAAVVSDIRRRFPMIGEAQIAQDAQGELRSFGQPPIRQYLPVLIARRLQARYRAT